MHCCSTSSANMFNLSKRWEMAILLHSGIAIVYALRVNMSVAAQDMRDELNWTEYQKGLALVCKTALIMLIYRVYNWLLLLYIVFILLGICLGPDSCLPFSVYLWCEVNVRVECVDTVSIYTSCSCCMQNIVWLGTLLKSYYWIL